MESGLGLWAVAAKQGGLLFSVLSWVCPRQLLRSVQGPSSSLSLVSMAVERSLLHFWWKC